VHALGYNWLQSNRISALNVKRRITNLVAKYNRDGFQCEKVILVTHSMGGLLARALIHPDIGGMLPQVLGVVHSVMPAIGAPSAYKRMRAGFEADGGTEFILGRAAWQVTPVLANSPGALELLPSCAYGNGWLEFRHNKVLLGSLPQNGDPYTEIYKRDDCWFKLIREEWLNPAELDGSNLQQTHKYLDEAKRFHEQIDKTYHPVSYGHYGTDTKLPSYETVCWTLSHRIRYGDWRRLHIVGDSGVGNVYLSSSPSDETGPECVATLAPSTGAGDKTVPVRSAAHQLHSKQFRGLFLQEGYAHQDSLRDQKALHSTMYSIARIAQQMNQAQE
jgi:pimeloyl-ACP methyl ester carboxylesterase